MRAGRNARGSRGNRGTRIPWIPIIGVLVGIAEAFAIKFLFHVDEPIYGVIVALITVVISMQIDQIVRTQEAVERALGNGVFWQKLEQAPWARTIIEQIVDSTATIDVMPNNEMFVRYAKQELQKCHDNIRELSLGRIRARPAQFRQVVIPMADKVSETIRAVAVVNPRHAFEWWDTPPGREYWECNIKALQKRVRIERVFVYQATQDGLLPEELQRLAQSQAKEGVKIYTVETAKLPADLRVDMAVFDDDFLFELRLSADGEPLRYFCSTTAYEINRRIRHFNEIKSYAEPLDMNPAEAPAIAAESPMRATTGDFSSPPAYTSPPPGVPKQDSDEGSSSNKTGDKQDLLQHEVEEK
jgi:hypothetical protein